MSRVISRKILVFVLLLAELAPASHASALVVTPGRGIGPVRLWMTENQVKSILGPSTPVASSKGRYPLSFPSQGVTVWFSKGRVVKVRTVNPDHKTVSGFAPGDTRWEQARQALCHGGRSEASATRATPAGFEIRCPLRGVVLEVSQGRVVGLSVIPIAKLRARRTPRP